MTTLLDLLIDLQHHGASSEQVLVAMALDQILSGRVVLCGIFSSEDTIPPIVPVTVPATSTGSGTTKTI